MSGFRVVTVVIFVAGVLALVAVLTGHPLQVGMAGALVFVSAVALMTVRRLAEQAHAPAIATRTVLESQPAIEQLREVAKAVATADGSRLVDRSLQGLLRSIASARLAKRGVDLDRDARRARALLGDDLWEIVRSQGESEQSRAVRPVGIRELEQMVERLEMT